MMMWLCETDGVLVADQGQHTRYTGHHKYTVLDVQVVSDSGNGEHVQAPQDIAGVSQAPESTPEWYVAEKAAQMEAAANPPDWPPTNPKQQR